MPLPEKLRKEAEKVTGSIHSLQALTGGDINELYRLKTEKGNFVLKMHARPPAGFFDSEAAGLAALKEGGLDVPRVLLCGDNYLLMEYLEPGTPDLAKAGEQLAALHRLEAPHFGYSQDTYLATILQANKPASNPSDFFFQQRVVPLTKLLGYNKGREADLWKIFSEKSAGILDSCPFASLLHGDLWAGNQYHAKRGPVFIDPACYCGDALTDIAMTRLFGGFGTQFYEAYFANSIRREYREELLAIFQIYPLLVHALLFGGGYYRSACAIRERFS